MANHIKYIKDVTFWPLEKIVQTFVTQKLSKSPENSLNSNGYVILDVRAEHIELKGGTKKTVHRVFIQSNDSGSYCKTGWIVRDDLDSCMICSKSLNDIPASSFSLFRTGSKTASNKKHCRACGNIICEDCSGTKAIVYPMVECPSRVCILCNYGQFPVDPIPNDTLGVSLFSHGSSSSSSSGPAAAAVATPSSSSLSTEGLSSSSSKKFPFPSSLLSPLKNSPLKSNTNSKKNPFSSPKGSPSRFFSSSSQKAKPIEPLVRTTNDSSSSTSSSATATTALASRSNPRSPYEDLLEMDDEEYENSIYEELDCYYDPYPIQNIKLYDYGRIELCRIKPVFVLRAFYCDETFVFINLTECEDVPYHQKSSKGVSSDQKGNKKEVFCIVYGEQMIAHNGIPTIDCAVNSQLIQEAKNDPSRLHEVTIFSFCFSLLPLIDSFSLLSSSLVFSFLYSFCLALCSSNGWCNCNE
jgi:hypothetical protein